MPCFCDHVSVHVLLCCGLQDLSELERLHGRGEVCLRLKFKRGLHPFFPPQLQLLRPRCLGPIAGALASHPMLQAGLLPQPLLYNPCCIPPIKGKYTVLKPCFHCCFQEGALYL